MLLHSQGLQYTLVLLKGLLFQLNWGRGREGGGRRKLNKNIVANSPQENIFIHFPSHKHSHTHRHTSNIQIKSSTKMLVPIYHIHRKIWKSVASVPWNMEYITELLPTYMILLTLHMKKALSWDQWSQHDNDIHQYPMALHLWCAIHYIPAYHINTLYSNVFISKS